MPVVEITIPIDCDWPTAKQLRRRDRIEAALSASGIGLCVGAGGGLGEMHLSYRVSDTSRLSIVDVIMAEHMAGASYQVKVLTDVPTVIAVKAGDLFAIPLADRFYALGLSTYVFKNMPGFIACRVFDLLMPEPSLPEPLPTAVAFDPLFLNSAVIENGDWPIVGNNPTEPGSMIYCSAGGVYDGEKFLRPERPDDKFPKLLLGGGLAVQNELRQFFAHRLRSLT